MFRRFAVAVFGVVLALGVVSVSSATVKPPALTAPVGHIVPAHGHLLTSPQGTPIVGSTNTSGYAATPKSGQASAFRYVTASFTVPSLSCPAPAGIYNGDLHVTAITPGIGQFGYMAGVNSQCEPDGSILYQGWYYIPGEGAGGITNVDPGDAISSSVFYKAKTGVYTLKLTDHTTGQGFDVTRNSPIQNTVAEVVTVGEGNVNDGMANFGAVHFHTIKVADSAGHNGGLTSANWTTDEVIALGRTSGLTEAQPGLLYAASPPAQSAFETTWLRGS